MMKQHLRKLFIIALGFVAGSCVTVGEEFDRTHISDIKPKVHDKEQIIAWFGKAPVIRPAPDARRAEGCTEVWVYKYARVVTGRGSTSDELYVAFDQQGIVCANWYYGGDTGVAPPARRPRPVGELQ